MDIQSIQRFLEGSGLDGWLLYDFAGSNPVARTLCGAEAILSRRWFCLVPRCGQAVWIHHRIESGPFRNVAGEKLVYWGWRDLWETLEKVIARNLPGRPRVAMEYSPGGSLPTVSRVDAGTLERVRSLGVEVVSSADLIQSVEALWSDRDLAAHRRACDVLQRILEEVFETVSSAVRAGREVTEGRLRRLILERIGQAGLVTVHHPIVACGAVSSDPHYDPPLEAIKPIETEAVLLVDLWAKEPGGVFADVTWMAFTGSSLPEPVVRVWNAVCAGRDEAVRFIEQTFWQGRSVLGWEVDRRVREVIAAAGFDREFCHRTGHSLGRQLHASGANLDDLETHDDRRLVVGTSFTVEPGIYLEDLGVRSEIDVHLSSSGPVVISPVQNEVRLLL